MFGNYTDCLCNNKIILKSQQRFKNYNHDVYTEEIKVALSAKRLLIKDYKHMIRLQHTHMEEMLLRYVKVKC